MINIKKIIAFLIISLLSISGSYAKIEDAIYATVANKAITHSDIINEIKIILILNGQMYSEDRKEILEKMAIKSVIKREIKKIEVEKYPKLKFKPSDLEKELNNLANNLNLDLNTLKDAFITNEIDFSNVVEQIKTELLWNTLIFEIYKNRITINKDEIDDQLSKFQNQNKEKIEEYLISEIVIRSVEKDKIESEIKRIKDKISIEGFANVAMDVSISETSVSGGNLGWVSENSISEELKSKIAMTPIGNISEPIFLQEGILFFTVRDKRISNESRDLEEEKNRLVNAEKAKILRMHSLSHYDNVRRTISIRYY